MDSLTSAPHVTNERSVRGAVVAAGSVDQRGARSHAELAAHVGDGQNAGPNGRATLRRGAMALLAGGLLGKVAGIARELVFAATYGTSQFTAAFRVGQTATLIPLNLVTSDALNSGFLPLHGRAMRESRAEAEDLYRTTQWALVGVTILVALVVYLFATPVVNLLAPGLALATQKITVDMVRVMVLGMPLYVAGALNSYLALALGHYRLVSLRSTLQNFGLLAGIVVAAFTQQWIYLAWGFTLGCTAYSLAGWGYVRRKGLLGTRWGWRGFHAAWTTLAPLLRVLRGLLAVPLLIQANEALERVVASLLSTQTVAATEFANFIVDTCVVLLAVPLGLAGLATIGHAQDVVKAARVKMESLTPLILAASLPLSVLCVVHARPIVRVLYARGEFDSSSVAATAVLLAGFAVGLWAQILGYVYVKIYSGTLQVKKVVWATVLGLALGMTVMAVALPTHDAFFIGLGASCGGIATTVVAARQAGVLAALLRWLLVFAPGAFIMLIIALLLPGASVPMLCLSFVASLAAWTAYCLSFPRLRRSVADAVGPRARVFAGRWRPGPV